MTYARKIEGAWQRWDGTLTIFTKQTTEAVLQRHDGSTEVVTVPPYTIEVQMSATPAMALMSDAELAELGLSRIQPFVPPEGKRPVGEARFVEADGMVAEVFDELEDIPPPPPEPTPAEKLAALGFTKEELKALLADD